MRDHKQIDPAFSSSDEIIFAIFILFISLTLPLFFHYFKLYSRERMYDQSSEVIGSFSFIKHEIFEETKPIDILFLSPSVLHMDIDTRYIKTALEKAEGKDVTVLTFGTTYRGEELYYLLLRDLLQKRKVKMIVFHTPRSDENRTSPHRSAYSFWSFGDEPHILDGLPLHSKISFYAMSVLGGPRYILNFIRPNSPYKNDEATRELGSLKIFHGYNTLPFVRKTFTPLEVPAEDMIYSEKTKDNFSFTGPELNFLQAHFIRKIGELAKNHDAHLVILSAPKETEIDEPHIQQRIHWSEFFGMDVDIIGISPKRLFHDFNKNSILDIFYFDGHFNVNGNEFFTQTIFPAIRKIYDDKTTGHQ